MEVPSTIEGYVHVDEEKFLECIRDGLGAVWDYNVCLLDSRKQA